MSATATTTPAGTVIRNVATLDLGTGTIPSNEVALTVARLIDVAVAAQVPSQPVTDVRMSVVFTVRNTGNAEQRILLSATAAAPGAALAGITVDGRAVADIVLAPGEARSVAVAVDHAGANTGDIPVTLTATAAEGHGAPGSTIGDAIIGPGGASAVATSILTRGAPLAQTAGPVLLKSQQVVAPDGSARVMPGAVVTYRLEARFPDATPGVAIDDRIPAGTAYVAGSITLDGAAQADAARFDGAVVHIALGDVAAASTHVVQFKVNIQ